MVSRSKINIPSGRLQILIGQSTGKPRPLFNLPSQELHHPVRTMLDNKKLSRATFVNGLKKLVNIRQSSCSCCNHDTNKWRNPVNSNRNHYLIIDFRRRLIEGCKPILQNPDHIGGSVWFYQKIVCPYLQFLLSRIVNTYSSDHQDQWSRLNLVTHALNQSYPIHFRHHPV